MSTPLDAQFWQDEQDALYEDLLPVFLSVLAFGLDSGTESLPSNLQALVNVNAFNQAAIDYAKQYKYGFIKDITETTRTQTQQLLTDWLRSGQPLDVLEQSLTSIYSDVRAAAIAATETTRVTAEGNAMAWKSTGFINQVQFHTAEDDRVCPFCSPLDGQLFDVDDYGHKPPIHVNCRCYSSPFVDEDAVAEQIKGILGL